MTDSTNSTPMGTSVDQVAAVNALLAEEFNPVAEEPKKKDETGAENGQPDLSTLLEDEGEGSAEAEAQTDPDEDVTWASALGLDDSQIHLDDNGQLTGLKVKVDGQESVVPVKELIAGYQTAKSNTQKSQALAEDKRQFEQVRDSAASTFLNKLEQAERLAMVMQQRLADKFQGVNLDELRQTNPAEYVARKDEMESEFRKIQTTMQAIENERNQIAQYQQQQHQQQFTQFLASQAERVLANNPEWQDHGKMVTALKEMSDVVCDRYGFSPEEIASINDARFIEALKDLTAFTKGKALANEKVSTAPKFMKGGKTSKPMDKLTQLTLNARKAKGANKISAQAAAVNELLAGL